MQKWLPNEFVSESSVAAAVVHGSSEAFESEQSLNSTIQNTNQRLFQRESGFSCPEAIMAHLTQEERGQVFDLVEQDIKAEYEQREKELRTSLATELSEKIKIFEISLGEWSQSLNKAMATHMKETADASARLAVLVAEKIIRKEIGLDNEILIRAIETALYKIDGTKTITISVNPAQAEWLETLVEVKERLGIHQVVSDRRVEPGGCVIKTEKQEWDVTISGQLEYLSELVEEMISTADEPVLLGKDGTDAEPILE